MPSVHLLNVKPGDCTLIQHASGRVTMVDVCDGNLVPASPKGLNHLAQIIAANPGGLLGTLGTRSIPGSVTNSLSSLAQLGGLLSPRPNHRMCESPTNPIEYARQLDISQIFRFILTHPDMDHLDGFDRVMNEFTVLNYWDSGARKPAKPDFQGSPYKEEDWDRYVSVRDGREPGVSSVRRTEGDDFKYANQSDQPGGGGDGLDILSPNATLLIDPDPNDDLNDASYVLLYRSTGGRILLPGDAHDAAWAHVCRNHRRAVSNCSFLLAPHHGRDSDRSYDFLDVVRPHLTLIGCSPSEHIDYAQWTRRGLEFITSNQSGNVVLQIFVDLIQVYVENERFAQERSPRAHLKNAQGYSFIYEIQSTAE